MTAPGQNPNQAALSKALVPTLVNSVLLAGSGGYLDGFTWVGHGHVFANAMTGNVVLLGVNCISGSWSTGFRHLPPILMFLLGISAARAIGVEPVARRLGNAYLTVLFFEIAILSILSLLPVATPDFWITMSIAFAASMQVETFRKVNGHSFNSTFTTGNLRTLSEGAVDWLMAGHTPEAALVVRDFGAICTAFFAGAVAGGYVTARLQNRALWCVIALLLIVACRVFLWRKNIFRRKKIAASVPG
jgi:uncharacterized membrane protein YoaK (UPF0700 family)